jgi:hypothetical protein
MYTRSFASLLLAVLAVAVVTGFQQHQPNLSRSPASSSSTTAVYGIFDKMKKSMESGYAGGDDSPYAKIKEQDAKREAIRKKKADERKKRGYTDLKDVKKKSFVKLTYDEPDEPEEEKKFFGLF